jgi:hypothetical protein
MATIDNLRNDIIAKLLTISNKAYLDSIYEILKRSTVGDDVVQLTDEQIVMLKMSDEDIKHGRLVSQNSLDDADLAWLKEL